MNHANKGQPSPSDAPSKFYRLELFEGGELTQIQFFDSDELDEAKESAISAITSGAADHAEVRDDSLRLIFHPFGRSR